MQAIVEGWLPEVIGWHCTVSDQFMIYDGADPANAPLGGGTAVPTVMEFPITFDGVWVQQFPPPTFGAPTGSYFSWPILKVFQKGPSQPNAQPVPAGYRAYVTKVSVEVGYVSSLAAVWDPGDYTRWFWKKKPVATPANPTPAYAVVPGAAGRPCQSRTLYGTKSLGGTDLTYQQLYFYPQASMPPIFLEPGELSVLRVENYTSDTTQSVALSMSVSGVMWPIGLEGS